MRTSRPLSKSDFRYKKLRWRALYTIAGAFLSITDIYKNIGAWYFDACQNQENQASAARSGQGEV
jgi:hypothetical protein